MIEMRYLDDVSTLVLDEEKCIGCTLCTEVCPHAVFEMKKKEAGVSGLKAVVIDFNACMECGACVNNCPSKAISVSPGVG